MILLITVNLKNIYVTLPNIISKVIISKVCISVVVVSSLALVKIASF